MFMQKQSIITGVYLVKLDFWIIHVQRDEYYAAIKTSKVIQAYFKLDLPTIHSEAVVYL